MNFLESLVHQRRKYESPLSFWKWAGLCAISACVKDNIYLDRQIYKLYPNIYVMLHAESGLKKGPPVALAAKLVRGVNNTHIIEGRSSIQGILKEMGTSKSMPGGGISTPSKIFICSSELSSSIVEDKVATTILTDLYDRQYRTGEWKSLLKMETFQLKDPIVTMFTATNEAHSEDFFVKKDIQGGYFARTFIVYENQPNRINSLSGVLRDKINDDESIAYLKQLESLRGEIRPFAHIEESEYYHTKITDEDGDTSYYSSVGIIYEEWYHDFRKTAKEMEIKDETGTLNRFGDSVLKVAMLLSLAEKPELIITEESMREAIRMCEKLIGAVRKTTLGARGMSNNAMLKARIIHELINRDGHQISQVMLMKKMWMHISNQAELADLMLSFDSAGMIKTQSVGNQIVYYMPSDMVEEMRKFMAGKITR